MPPTEKRKNLRFSARAIDLPILRARTTQSQRRYTAQQVSEPCFADAGRPDEADDLALRHLSAQLADRDELQDALLDVLHAVVVLVQHLPGAINVEVLLRELAANMSGTTHENHARQRGERTPKGGW